MKIAQRQLDIIEEKKNKFEAKAAMAEEKATEAEKKYNEVKAKIDKKTPTLNKQVMREMQALGYHLGAIDTQNRLESIMSSRLNCLMNSVSSWTVLLAKFGMVPLWNKLPRIHLLFARSPQLSSWATLIVQRPLLLVMEEVEVLAVVGVKG